MGLKCSFLSSNLLKVSRQRILALLLVLMSTWQTIVPIMSMAITRVFLQGVGPRGNLSSMKHIGSYLNHFAEDLTLAIFPTYSY